MATGTKHTNQTTKQTTKNRREDCASPPHPGHATSGRDRSAVLVAAGAAAGRGLAGVYRWLRAKNPERGPLPALPGVYTAGGVAHAADVPALTLAPVTVGASGLTYGLVQRSTGDEAKASKSAAAVAAAGAWTSTAAEAGLLAGPAGMVSWSWLALFGLGYGIYRCDQGIKTRIEWREAKTHWHQLAPKLGLGGSHLLHREDTRLGEAMVIDTTGTGKRASQLASSDLAETYAELESLPAQRVRVNADRIAGRLRISVRRKDPWANPSPHPLLDSEPEVSLPAQADVTRPLPVGADPETGRPLQLEVFNEDGAVNTLIVAIKGGGKTVLLNNTLERLTSSPSELVIGIDVSKGKDLRRWRDAGALGPTAIGRNERAKAVKILAAVEAMINYRAETNPDPVWQPAPGRPHITVVIDEIDKLTTGGDGLAQAACQHLSRIASTGRSEGIGVVLCGQRGTAQWIGGADVRANMDQFAIGKVKSSGEAAHAAGDLGLSLPDMGSYGEGHGGVITICSLGGSDYDAGRTFFFKEFADITKLATGRRPSAIEPALAEHLGDKWTSLHDDPEAARVQASPTPQAGDDSGQGQSLSILDQELEQSMPDDVSDSLARLRKAQETREGVRDYLNNLQIPQPPDDPDKAAALEQEQARRREEAAYAVEIPDETRQRLLEGLREGSCNTNKDICAAFGVSSPTAHRWMSRLRQEGLVELHGKGRGQRWHYTGSDGE